MFSKKKSKIGFGVLLDSQYQIASDVNGGIELKGENEEEAFLEKGNRGIVNTRFKHGRKKKERRVIEQQGYCYNGIKTTRFESEKD